ncbi:MAG: thermonuclease family protein [Ramlibacter sp.]
MTLRFHRVASFLVSLLAAMSAEARVFQGVVTHVTDGDSIWVRGASGGAPVEVRLQGIDAPEICQVFGKEARDALAGRVLRRQIAVNSRARDSYHRVLGHVTAGGQDLGLWMVSRGYAWSYRYRRDSGPYAAAEAQARQSRLGLWSLAAQPVEPRIFRRRHGSCH